MKKPANSPVRQVDTEELRDIIDIVAAKLSRATSQGELDIGKELADAIDRAKAKRFKRKPRRKPIDLEERALESRRKNADIEFVLAQTEALKKPWWKRETVALLTLIAHLLVAPGGSAKVSEKPPAIEITVRQVDSDPIVSCFYPYYKPLPRSQYLLLEIERVLRDGSESITKHEDPELVRTRIIQGLEDLKERETTKTSEMKSPAFFFSKAVEKQDITNLDHLIEFFRTAELEQGVTDNK